MACLFGHKWNGCKCTKCGKVRDENHQFSDILDKCEEKCTVCGKKRDKEHNWVGCKCVKCEKIRNDEHDWDDGKCKKCGKINFSNKFLIFIAHVGTIELVNMYGNKMAKDIIGINKIDWKGNLINKYPSAKSLTQMIINDDEWSHPHTGFVGNSITLNPFIVAATKHMTDKMDFSPQEAIDATMITANNNITVAASDGLGHGFVVIGVPIK